MEDKLNIGITHGDINGISYELIMKLNSENRLSELCTPVIYGSSKVAAYYRKTLNMENINFDSDTEYQIEVHVKYEGYINKANAMIEKQRKLEKKLIPEDFNYFDIKGITGEAKQKLLILLFCGKAKILKRPYLI